MFGGHHDGTTYQLINEEKAFKASQIVLLLGRYNISRQVEVGSEIRGVKEIKVHPHWDAEDKKFSGDIAILEMAAYKTSTKRRLSKIVKLCRGLPRLYPLGRWHAANLILNNILPVTSPLVSNVPVTKPLVPK